jgi:hypothetical protein
VGVTHPAVAGPQIVNVPLLAFEGSTVIFASRTLAPTTFDCCAYWSRFVGSAVETVTTPAFRLMEKIGTGTESAEGEIAVSEEIFGL